MFDKIIGLVVASTTAFTASFGSAQIEEYTLPSHNYVQEAVDNGVSVAKETGVSTVGISIIDRNSGNVIMRTNLEDAHKPMSLGSMGRIFILIKAVMDNKSIVDETQNNPVISMMADYSKKDTDALWQQHGGPAIVRELVKRYDLQETEVGSNWDNTKSSSVDISRLIRRFLDDPSVTENQKNWTLALLASTSLKIEDQEFDYGIPSARGASVGEGSSGSSTQGDASWVQGAPMNSSEGIYRYSSGVFGKDNNYIATIMAQFPEGTTGTDADTIMDQIAEAAVSPNSLDSNKPQQN